MKAGDRVKTDRRDALMLAGCRGGIVAEDAQHLAELRDVLEHPWPHPPITIADGGLRNAA